MRSKLLGVAMLLIVVSFLWGCLVAQLNLDAVSCNQVGGKWVNDGVASYILHPEETCELPDGAVRR